MKKSIEEKKPIEFFRADPERYQETNNGTFLDRTTGKICATFPALNPYAITKETAHSMHQRGRELNMIAQYRALAKRVGIDVDNANVEEVVKGAASAIEALHGHAYDLAMKATTARGIESIYPKIYEGLSAGPRGHEPAQPAPGTVSLGVSTLLQLATELENEIAARVARSQAIEVVPEWVNQMVEEGE